MLILPPETLLLTSEPIRSSWWQMVFDESPVGPMPRGHDPQLRRIPPLMESQTSKPYGALNASVSIPMGKEPTNGAFGFQMWSTTEVLEWWRAWRRKCFDQRTQAVGLYNDIVGQGVLTFYGPGCPKPTPLNKIYIVDCWPSALTMTGAEVDGDGVIEYEVTLEIADVTFPSS